MSIVFCTVKYVNHYLLVCTTSGQVIAYPDIADAQKSWKRTYVDLILKNYPLQGLERHFKFFQPMLHTVDDVDKFEDWLCPEGTRRLVNAEYISGNCIGLTCDPTAAAKLRERGTPVEVNFRTALKTAGRLQIKTGFFEQPQVPSKHTER